MALPSTEPVLDPLLPASMTEVAKPIGRDAVQQHLTGKGVVLAAINGLPGVGKTTLAVELAHNEEIRRHFTEGVLWAGLGPAPDMFALLSHWCTLLGVSSQQMAKLKTVEDYSNYFAVCIEQHRKHYDLLEQESNNIFAIMDAAYTHGYYPGLVRCIDALFPFLFTRGLSARQASIHIERAVEAARSLNDAVLLARMLRHQGKAVYKQGEYAKAELALQGARELASQVDDPVLLSDTLMLLGIVARFRTSYDQAEAYLQENLALARQSDDLHLLSDEAHAAFEEAMVVSSKGSQEVVASALYGLARVAAIRGEMAEARHQGQQCLSIFMEMGGRQKDTVKAWLESLS